MSELTTTQQPAPAQSLPAGTVVRCQRVQRGQKLGKARAVILGRFGEGKKAPYRVWFYPKGPARQGDDATVSLSFPHEISVRGQLADLSESQLDRIIKGSNGFSDASDVWQLASILRLRKRAQRAG